MEIIEDKQNPFLSRREIKVIARANKNPSMQQANQLISKQFKSEEDKIAVKGIKGKFGRNTFLIEANIYTSKEKKEEIEPKQKSGKKKTEEKKQEAEEVKEGAGGEPEEKKEEKPAGERTEEKTEQPAEEEKREEAEEIKETIEQPAEQKPGEEKKE